jgi:hypothetical protein
MYPFSEFLLRKSANNANISIETVDIQCFDAVGSAANTF